MQRSYKLIYTLAPAALE